MPNYDFRNPQNIYEENGVRKSSVPDTVHVTSCIHCNESNSIVVDTSALNQWANEGQYIQDVFTWLNSEQREILQTGIHPACWDILFPNYD